MFSLLKSSEILPRISEVRLLSFLPPAICLLPLLSSGTIIVAHRGASADAPENTMAAFNEAWRQGADAIEGDFRLTKDGQIIAMHDGDTGRTSGQKLVVSKTNWSTLKKLDAGSWKGAKWKGEKIPLLSEILASMPQGKGIFIEIKCGPEIVQKLSEVITQSKIPRKLITIISFNKEVVRAIKKHDPKLTANWLSDLKPKKGEDISSKLTKAIQTLKDIKADGLGAKAVDSLAAKLGSTLKQHGLGFHVWTVDAAAQGRHFVKAGVHSVTTNKPAKMREFLKGE